MSWDTSTGELPRSGHWVPRVVLAVVAVGVLVTVMLVQRPLGWGTVVALALAALGLYLAVVGWRLRARLAFDGAVMRVRTVRTEHHLRAQEVAGVRQRFTARGPDFVVDTPRQRLLVPVSRFEGGHSRFFRWLLADGHEPELDRHVHRTLDAVRRRGLLDE